MLCAPDHGTPYNQQAVLALKEERYADAVYMYMRSLSVSKPVLTAREGLAHIFDKVRLPTEPAVVSHHGDSRSEQRRCAPAPSPGQPRHGTLRNHQYVDWLHATCRVMDCVGACTCIQALRGVAAV